MDVTCLLMCDPIPTGHSWWVTRRARPDLTGLSSGMPEVSERFVTQGPNIYFLELCLFNLPTWKNRPAKRSNVSIIGRLQVSILLLFYIPTNGRELGLSILLASHAKPRRVSFFSKIVILAICYRERLLLRAWHAALSLTALSDPTAMRD